MTTWTTRVDAAALHRSALKVIRRGRLEDGKSMLETAVAARPTSPDLLADLAQVQLMTGDEPAAIETYRRCVALDPARAPAWLNLGSLLLRADRVADAGECFQAAITADTTLADAHAGLGLVCLRQHRLTDAAESLRTAASLAPHDPQIHSNLGGVLHELGEHDNAVAAFRAAIAAAPDQAALHTHLGVLRHEVQGAAAGLPHYDEALRLAPGHTRTLAAKHSALATLGRRDEAARIFDFDALIATVPLDAPEGYSDIRAFNAALAEHAANHPTLIVDPLGKTTRGGGQTGQLLGPTEGPIAALERMIRHAIAGYLADPARARHPHCPRGSARDRIFAWATVLDTGGYQDAHIHPSGTLSGVYYVQLPDEGDAGAIEFGRPAQPFTLPDPEVRLIRPEAGLLVMFPSFVWHRTIPFEGGGRRISIAFDLM